MSDTFDKPLTPVLLIQAEKDTTAHLVLEHVRLRMDGAPFNNYALILPELVDKSDLLKLQDSLKKLHSAGIDDFKVEVYLSGDTMQFDS